MQFFETKNVYEKAKKNKKPVGQKILSGNSPACELLLLHETFR